MTDASKGKVSIPKEFSVEKGYNIVLTFFYSYLFSYLEPKLALLGEDIAETHDLFFITICGSEESNAEWNEAIRRAKHIPKEKQRDMKLTEEDLFLCAIQFCKLHNESWEPGIDYTINLLESMKRDPKNHQTEWKLWKEAIKSCFTKWQDIPFDWNAYLSYGRSNTP
jgi:hypothetical protein